MFNRALSTWREREEETGKAKSHVEWVTLAMAREPIEEIVPKITADLQSFTSLTAPNGWLLWFDATKADGPMPLAGDRSKDRIHSAFKINGHIQFVRETHQEVRDVIAAAGGTPLPIPGRFAEMIETLKSWVGIGAKPPTQLLAK